MSETFFEGPAIALGPLIGGGLSKLGTPWSGPGAEYQGACVLDPSQYPANKDGLSSGRIKAWMNHSYFVMADNTPSAAGTATLAAAQAATNGTALTLTTVAPGGSGTGVPSLAPQIPIVPAAGGAVVTTALALDFGFATGNITAGSGSVTVFDATQFSGGQWIVIGGAGNAAKTASLITQVQGAPGSLPPGTTITISPVSQATLTNAPIGSANIYGLFPSGATPVAAQPYVNGGALGVFNPLETLARNVSVTANAGATGGVVIVTGYDIYNNLMHENITSVAATTVFGKKAFKYIVSAVPQFTDAGHTYSLGTGDVFGFHTRSDKWEYTNIFYNGTFVTTSTGWLSALGPGTPSTATTADVRGTVQVSTNGAGSSITGGTVTTGAQRLTLFMTIPVFNMLNATPANLISLFGNAQF